ncbi:MAG TPA: GNAT family N-acetyltransferase [Levilinea sp.]|nr:GNAT family N-acetyltransferase [Levilinea sp.]
MSEPILLELAEANNAIVSQALALYRSSFPAAEREPVENILDSISQRGRAAPSDGYVAHFFTAVQDGRVLGLAFYGYYRASRLGILYYLAVQPDLRGQGTGAWLFQRILAQLPQDAAGCGGLPPRGLAWEVERPVDAVTSAEHDLRQRRIRFYQRHGALLLESMDIQAPPLAEDLPPVMYHVMFLPSPGFDEQLSSQSFLIELLDTLLLHGYAVERDSVYYRNALKLVKGNG